jgi:RimJ/RimL family protein N-acetyltransferase
MLAMDNDPNQVEKALEPRLRNGTAFACALEHGGETPSACFAFENYGPVWEVGGVITAPSHRGRGFGADVVRTVLAELTGRGLTPRYQVETDNAASIALAQSAGLTRFLTVAHYAHEC